MDKVLTEKEKKLLAIKAKMARLDSRQKKYRDEKEKYKHKLVKHEEENRLCYFNHSGKGYLGPYGTWELNMAQKKIIDAIEEAKYKLIALTGDNQIGKTLLLTIVVIGFMRGHWPWEDPAVVGQHLWEKHGLQGPTHIRVVGSGWEEHIQRTLIDEGIGKFWPKMWPIKTKKNNAGADYKWMDQQTGSMLYFMSSEQKTIKFAGAKCDVILFDEPFPKEIWDENVMRIISKGGFILIAATLLEGDLWLYDEILDLELDTEQKRELVYHFEAAAKVNLGHGTSEKNVSEVSCLLTKEGKEMRMGGNSVKNYGRVIHYTDDCLIKRKRIPPEDIVIAAVDIGKSKEHDILWMGINPDGVRYFCFEEQVSGNGKAIGRAIVERTNEFSLRVPLVIIDPLAKEGQSMERADGQIFQNSYYNQLDDYLLSFGIELRVGCKFKDDGVAQLNDLFSLEPYGYPRLFIFDDLMKTKAQLKIRYKDGKIPKTNDDMFENAYRLVMVDLDWYTNEEPETEYVTAGSGTGRDKMTGY